MKSYVSVASIVSINFLVKKIHRSSDVDHKKELGFATGHPWIVDDTVAPDKPLGSAVLTRLKQFSAMNKLKKMALRVRVNEFCWSFFIDSGSER